MKKLYPFLLVLATPLILILMSNSTGSPGGRSGSPGDNGNTCTGCHTGTVTSKFGWITTNIPAEGFTPGQIYTITATGTHNGVAKFGFELTVESSQGDKVGSLQLNEPTRTKFTNGGDAVTHTAAGNVPNGNSNSWTMKWVAPSNVSGNVGIYAAFNAANGNGNTSGDVIYKSSIFVSEYAPPPLIVSISPNQAEQGDSFLATITGSNTNFTGMPNVSLSYSSNPFEVIAGTGVVVVSPTVVQAQFSIPSEATSGLYDLHVNDLVLEQAFTVTLLTGLSDNRMELFKIYPNPAVEHFTIENANGAEMSIYRTNGELLTSMTVDSDKQIVNVNYLSKGLYLVKIQLDGITRIEKLLIN